MSDARVAVVGTGRMGPAMATRLRARDVDVVVFNRTRSRAEAVAARTGATAADSARSAAAGAFEQPDGTPVTFSLDLVAKDYELILALAAEVGVPMPQAEAGRSAVAAALAAGLGARDMSYLAQVLRDRASPADSPS
ncbi:MAG: NAD(P)-binding domain-containing protein [Jiangellaceae bacterium]